MNTNIITIHCGPTSVSRFFTLSFLFVFLFLQKFKKVDENLWLQKR